MFKACFSIYFLFTFCTINICAVQSIPLLLVLLLVSLQLGGLLEEAPHDARGGEHADGHGLCQDDDRLPLHACN